MTTKRTLLRLPLLALFAFPLLPAPPVRAEAKTVKKTAPSAKITVSVADILDDRVGNTDFGFAQFNITLKLQGDDAAAVKSARVHATKATDDTGKNLLEGNRSMSNPDDWTEGRGGDPPAPALSMANPARKARTANVEGVLEAYLPSRDAQSTVRIEKILTKKDKPLSVPSLASQKIKLGVLSKQGLEKEKKEAEDKKKAEAAKNKKGGAEELGEALGGALTEMFERLFMVAGEHDLILKVDDPGKKIFSFGLVAPDGKPVQTYGTNDIGNYRILRMFEAPPEGSTLEVRLKSDKSFAEIPFSLAGIKLP